MTNEKYIVHHVRAWDVRRLFQVCKILYASGKSMADKYGLSHWDNSYFKDCIIVLLCALKNQIFLVYLDSVPVATFQIKKISSSLLFQKLATHPRYEGKGIGSFCMQKIEQQAKDMECNSVICEVYDKSTHAINFYRKKGYEIYGRTDTLKYQEVKMQKNL